MTFEDIFGLLVVVGVVYAGYEFWYKPRKAAKEADKKSAGGKGGNDDGVDLH